MRRRDLLLLAVNVAGIVIYLVAASPSWAIPQERELGILSTTGEPFVWAFSVLPVFCVFALVNLLWGAAICFRKRWRRVYFWVISATLWVPAIWIDFAHH